MLLECPASGERLSNDKHITRLTQSKYHEQGGCVVRHERAQNAECKYRINGYNITQSARSKDYNAPHRYAAEHVVDLKRKRVKRPGGGYHLSPTQNKAGGPVDPGIWNIGANGNFVPREQGGRGFHYPYLHNWHHLIANDRLSRALYDGEAGLNLLLLLMAAKYNLNGEQNIVLLPQQESVGRIIKWPIHPNNHGPYDDYAEKKLSGLKETLKKALDDKKVHQVDPKRAQCAVDELNRISKLLYRILRELPGGQHLNTIQQYGAAIDRKLERRAKKP